MNFVTLGGRDMYKEDYFNYYQHLWYIERSLQRN